MIMKKGLISVIIPVYNVEKYLERCICSVTDQTYSRLEIILIDDGSIDQCPVICDNWESRDSRITVIHQKNKGLGLARNTGIERASGEFICFVDSDDYVLPEMIEKAYHCALSTKAEIVVYGFYQIEKDEKNIKKHIPKPTKYMYEGEEVKRIFLPELIGPDTSSGKDADMRICAWNCLISMRLIDRLNWRFVSEREYISEDIYSIMKLYQGVHSVAVLPEAMICNCERNNSVSQIYRADRYQRIKECHTACLELCNLSGYNTAVEDRLHYSFFSNTIGAMKSIIVNQGSISEKLGEIRAICEDEYMQDILSQVNIGHEKTLRRILLIIIKKRWFLLCSLLLRLKTGAIKFQ